MTCNVMTLVGQEFARRVHRVVLGETDRLVVHKVRGFDEALTAKDRQTQGRRRSQERL